MHRWPATIHPADSPPILLPDLIVEQLEGDWKVRLEDLDIPSLRLSDHYLDLLADKNTSIVERNFIQKQIDSAKRFISSMEKRQETLCRIAIEIMKAQRGFLDHGVQHLHALRLQEIADALGLHVSTVSNAILDKHIKTPRGIFPLKYFVAVTAESND